MEQIFYNSFQFFLGNCFVIIYVKNSKYLKIEKNTKTLSASSSFTFKIELGRLTDSNYSVQGSAYLMWGDMTGKKNIS